MSNQPIDGSEPWLVKFNAQDEDIEVCEIEKFYLDTAALCGLPVPESKVFHVNDKIAAIGMKLFDRLNGMRIPMHSLAGVLHANFRIPNCSYGIYLRMTRFMTRNEQEVEKAFKYCVFNVCMNNRDDHTKNFSYLMNQHDEWALSPAYDLTYNPGRNDYRQMDVESEAYKIKREHLISLAKNSGLDVKKSEAVIDAMIDVVKSRLSALSGGKYAVSKATAAMLQDKISGNLELLSSKE